MTVPGGGPAGGRSTVARWWPLLLLAALAVVVVAVVQHPSAPLATVVPEPATTAPAPNTTARTSGSFSGSDIGPSPNGAPTSSSDVPVTGLAPPLDTGGGAPTVTRVGHAIAGVTADWELFGLSADGLVRLQLAKGLITRTPLPRPTSSGPVSLVLGPDRAVIRPLDYVAGYQVLDGHPATELPAALGVAGPALPGPDPNHFWAQRTRDAETLTLTGWRGSAGRTTISPPADSSLVGAQSDGGGGVLFETVSGLYRSTDGRARLLSTGNLVAAGGGRVLVSECATTARCSTVLIDAKGARRVIPVPAGTVAGTPPATVASKFAGSGLISPDGTLAVAGLGGTAGLLTILDLSTGKQKPMPVGANPESGLDAVVVTPDSRSLYLVDQYGVLNAVNLESMHVTQFGVNLPPLTKLVLRP